MTYIQRLLQVFACLYCCISCNPKTGSTLQGDDYDAASNATRYFVLPMGQVSMPGRWTKTHYNNSSHQQFFADADSVKIAIAFNRYDKYAYNPKGQLKGFAFVKGFYEWDATYFEQLGLRQQLISSDSAAGYLIWRLTGTQQGAVYDSWFLFGEKQGNVSNFSIMKTDAWTDEQKQAFLKQLFLH